MGAKLAEPDRPILVLIGDGGLLFATGDLATLIQYQIPIIIVVFNDHCYGSIRKAQRQNFGRTIGVDLQNPDFCALAQAFGIPATQVSAPAQLTAALRAAWQTPQPHLIEIAMTPNDPGFEI
jgi:thiamine pyrophosphate-dependent acetolactate synthase large subunit-like protein